MNKNQIQICLYIMSIMLILASCNINNSNQYKGVPLGTIVAYALSKDSVPNNWLLCDGSEIPAKYQQLRIVLGDKNTPNLMGRTLIGSGQPVEVMQDDGFYPNFPDSIDWSVKEIGGEFKHQLTQDELPKHTHPINNGEFGFNDKGYEKESYKNKHPYTMNPGHFIIPDSTGGNSFHYNMQPYFVVNYIIYAGE